MSDIARARALLRRAKQRIDEANHLVAEALPLLDREPAVRRAKTDPRARLDPTLAARIKTYAIKHPKMHYRDIAHHFNVDSGRVSEIMSGKRFS